MLYIFKLRKCTILNKYNIFRYTHGLTLNNIRKEKVNEIFPQKHEFQIRHIGPRQYEQLEMLKTIGYKVIYIIIILFDNENINFLKIIFNLFN